jgi:hypothetical protein
LVSGVDLGSGVDETVRRDAPLDRLMSVDHGQIPITNPCPITLERGGVAPADRSMYCDHCVKDVHLLSKMTEPEARSFLREHEGQDICVSYAIRTDGAIRFRAAPKLVPVEQLTRRPSPARHAPQRLSMVASIGAAALLAACTAHSEPEPEPTPQAAPSAQVEPIEPAEPVVHTPPVVEPCEPLEVNDIHVDGGIRAMPLDEPPPPIIQKPPKREPKMMVRGGIRAQPLDNPHPLGD